MVPDSIFAEDFVTRPYWWDAAPPESADDEPIPVSADVAIVGSGYCGLVAAITLARSGLSVVVLEAGSLGQGASSRSGGMVSSGQKLVLSGAHKRFGAEQSERVFEESKASFDFISDLIARENLDADYQRYGRFFAAFTARDLKTLEKHADLLRRRTGVDAHIVSRSDQREEIGSDFYHGGMVVEDYGGLHPAKYNLALRNLARSCSATLCSNARVETIESVVSGFRLFTPRGELLAKEVIVATNGYTDKAVPYLHRRIIPVASHMVATEALPKPLMKDILPKLRMMSDTRFELAYFRPSPDHQRLLFGFRPSFRDRDDRTVAHGIYRRILQIFPQLGGVRLSHVWRGNVAMTFDRVPHMGTHRGIHYAMGCNGNGVAMATYLGHQTGLKILGAQNRLCIFDGRPFPSLPLYSGVPWMVPLVSGYYHLRDALVRPGAAVNFL